MNKITLAFLTAAFFSVTGFCGVDAKAETDNILKKTISQGIEILKGKETSDAQKLKLFDGLLDQSCHTDLMSMLALGRQGWGVFKTEQRKEFTIAFVNLMTRTYYSKLNQADVTNVKVEYKDNIEISKSKRTLKTLMSSSDNGFEVCYKFALRKGRWAVYDMEVEGISLIASYRSQFTDFLKSKSPAELLLEMKSNDEKFSAVKVVP